MSEGLAGLVYDNVPHIQDDGDVLFTLSDTQEVLELATDWLEGEEASQKK